MLFRNSAKPAPAPAIGQLAQWTTLTASVTGYFMDESAAVWDVLLGFQTKIGQRGGIVEIGVLEGKSAALLALHLQERELLTLIDLGFTEATKQLMTRIAGQERLEFLAMPSGALWGSSTAASKARTCRWIHIDGGHTGEEVTGDLRLASLWMQPSGIIVLDDFMNPAYPQVTAAVFHYLTMHPFDLTLFLCGHNKGYLCAPTQAHAYLDLIRRALYRELAARGIKNVTIFKTTQASDMNCFGVSSRFKDHDYYGLDADPSIIPL